MTENLLINNREYPSIFSKTAIVICLDGSQKEYLEEASKSNLTPNLDSLIASGQNLLVHSAIPSFTNPNNISIVTGQPSSVHGICGNFFYTPETGEEVMMNDPKYMRAPTIFEKFYNSGSKIALVTAKDKLRTLLGNGLSFDNNRAICFSAEKSDQATKELNGIDNVNDWLGMPVPEVYSEGLSEFVMAAGVKLLEEFKPNIMYLSTTDYIQHKFAPGTEGGYTKLFPENKVMPVFDAVVEYKKRGTDLVVIGGKEYGTGSSRDWAAKGTKLLGIKAVIAESFERIHRSNLVGMGILPLQFKEGFDRKKLNIKGTELFTIIDIEKGINPRAEVSCEIKYADGSSKTIKLLSRIDTENEIEYYKNGGILQYVLRNMLN